MSNRNPMPDVRRVFVDTRSGSPIVAAGYKLHTYLVGTSTDTNTWQNDGTLNSNPITLDSEGGAEINLDAAVTYKFELRVPADTTVVWDADNVPGSVPANAPWTLERDSIGATSTDALILLNATVAANGAQQWSPRARWTGAGWNATSSASRVVDVIAEAVPQQQGSGDPLVALVFSTQVNGAGYTSRVSLRSDGQFLVNTNKFTVDASGNIANLGNVLVNTDKFTVNGTTGWVGLGTASPVAQQHIYVGGTAPGITTSSTQLVIQNNSTTAGSTGITFINGVATGTTSFRFGTSANQAVNSLTYDQATGLLTYSAGIAERLRTFAMGATQTRTYAGGNYTAATGTWTVDSGDVTSETFRIVGDTMWFSGNYVTTALSNATLSVTVAVPAGYTIAETVRMPTAEVVDSGGVNRPCRVVATASGGMVISALDGANLAAGAASVIAFQINFKVS